MTQVYCQFKTSKGKPCKNPVTPWSSRCAAGHLIEPARWNPYNEVRSEEVWDATWVIVDEDELYNEWAGIGEELPDPEPTVDPEAPTVDDASPEPEPTPESEDDKAVPDVDPPEGSDAMVPPLTEPDGVGTTESSPQEFQRPASGKPAQKQPGHEFFFEGKKGGHPAWQDPMKAVFHWILGLLGGFAMAGFGKSKMIPDAMNPEHTGLIETEY